MAAYNGSRWIGTQIASILSQLREGDELIVVDDCSCDDTVQIVQGIRDSRIRLFQNSSNLGVDATFERAICNANGQIVFLSDQDDLWYPDKVQTVLAEFARSPKTTLVISDADIIDANSDKTGATYFELRGGFVPGVLANIGKSRFLGCAIAIRSDVLRRCLPFPSRIPGHDMWIGVVNELYGRSYFIERPLMGYRRHGSNLSAMSHGTLVQMIVWRLQLICGLISKTVFGKSRP